MDWDLGHYEQIAGQLAGAGESLLAAAAPVAGLRLLDVGCGSGGLALAAAEEGALVSGADPAERLVALASEAARAAGLAIDLRCAAVEELPYATGSFDILLSNFGVIFAADAQAAIAELARVTAAPGLMLLSAWLPEGPLFELAGLRAGAARASGIAAPARRFEWHRGDELASAFAIHGFFVEQALAEIRFRAASASAFLEREMTAHPLWVALLATLDAQAREDLYASALELLEAANEDRDGFRVTSRYVVSRLQRP